MPRLLILRHAKAEAASPAGGDHERPLAARGHDDAAKIGAYLRNADLAPKVAVLSSARRVQETWAGIVAELPLKPSSQTERQLYNATPEDILAVIRAIPGGESPAIVVGHNPGLHAIALYLIASGDAAARERLASGFPTSGLVVIDFPATSWSVVAPRSGKLQHFVSPSTLAASTD
jgi:phosphohistidine phosphatase